MNSRKQIPRGDAQYGDLTESDISKKYDSDDFETWEGHYDLHEKEDYQALVKYCEKEVAQNSKDPHAKARLGEAYVLNKQYQTAIDAMKSCHREYPDAEDFTTIILDALFALGKTEDDFEWKQDPCILRIGKIVIDECYQFLKNKRKPLCIEDICIPLIMKGYLKFDTDELCEALKADRRFVVEKEDFGRGEVVRIKRKKDAEQTHAPLTTARRR